MCSVKPFSIYNILLESNIHPSQQVTMESLISNLAQMVVLKLAITIPAVRVSLYSVLYVPLFCF